MIEAPANEEGSCQNCSQSIVDDDYKKLQKISMHYLTLTPFESHTIDTVSEQFLPWLLLDIVTLTPLVGVSLSGI